MKNFSLLLGIFSLTLSGTATSAFATETFLISNSFNPLTEVRSSFLIAQNTLSSVIRANVVTPIVPTEPTGTTFTRVGSSNQYQAIDTGANSRNRTVTLQRFGNVIQMKANDSTQDTYRGIITGNRINGIWFNPNVPRYFGTWDGTLEF